MYLLSLFFIFLGFWMMFEGKNFSAYVLAILILTLVGFYIYIDLRILISGPDAIEREPITEDQNKTIERKFSEDTVEAERQSGRVYPENGKLIWEFKGDKIAEVDLSKVKLVGEYTTDGGPFVDDWFLVFYYSADENVQISMYAVGMLKMLQDGIDLGNTTILTPHLVSSTHWKNRILWPMGMEDMEFWTLKVLPPEAGWEMFRYLIGYRRFEIRLTGDASYILSNSRTDS